jgi:hypothetical protein
MLIDQATLQILRNQIFAQRALRASQAAIDPPPTEEEATA